MDFHFMPNLEDVVNIRHSDLTENLPLRGISGVLFPLT